MLFAYDVLGPWRAAVYILAQLPKDGRRVLFFPRPLSVTAVVGVFDYAVVVDCEGCIYLAQ